ncbi:Thymidylate synthase [compost metagenome]
MRLAFEELWFFLNGEIQTKKLEEKGINFWTLNTSREFLDKQGLQYLPEGCLGRAYSKQFRDFGGNTGLIASKGVDQLQKLLDELAHNPTSRRLMIDLWNPAEHQYMPLTPCWFNMQVVVVGEYLNVKLRNRSIDLVFGNPFAVEQYRLFQLALCKMFGYKLGELSCDYAHCHIYNSQIEYAKELVQRDFGKQGEVVIKKELHCMQDLLSLQWEDFEIVGLEVNKTPFVTAKPSMAA